MWEQLSPLSEADPERVIRSGSPQLTVSDRRMTACFLSAREKSM